MLGVDIVKISRFQNATESTIKRILHPNEIDEYNKSENKSKYLASRWAIKEALFKIDNNLSTFSKIYIEKNNSKYIFSGYQISTSDEDDIYIAIAIKE